MKEIRLGIVGLGRKGGGYHDLLSGGKVPGMSLVAISDLNPAIPRRFPEQLFYRRSEELMKSKEIDAVLISTPVFSHLSDARWALEAGLHVLVEPPVVAQKADLERLLAIPRSNQQVFAMASILRTRPHFRQLREWIQTGKLGGIRRVKWTINEFRPPEYYHSELWRNTWEGAGGGILLNPCFHQLDIWQWLFGMPRSVHAECLFGRHHPVEVEDEVSAILEYPDGPVASFHCSIVTSGASDKLEIESDCGQVILHRDKLSFAGYPELKLNGSFHEADLCAHEQILINFAAAIRAGKALIAPAAEGVRSLELANAMVLSSLRTKSVALPFSSQEYEREFRRLVEESKRRRGIGWHYLPPEQAVLPAHLNYDESKVEAYDLPDALVCDDGEPVTSPEIWRTKRRGEVLELFQKHVYGRMLPRLPISAIVVEESDQALSGKATRRQVEIRFESFEEPVLHLQVYSPNESTGPFPCFLGLNFGGNHTVVDDMAIPVSTAWVLGTPENVNNRATESSRGADAGRWPLEMLIDQGYALATLCYGDIDPDFDDGFVNGVHSLFCSNESLQQGDNPGSITAWAWGLSRVMDYLETLPEIDARRVYLTGQSRMGKTALWAAACDERFAMVFSNNSGCLGASISRRNLGETPYLLSNIRTHWFCRNLRHESFDIASLPVDQHMLIGLIAPRPVFVASAEGDSYADPKGEFLSAFHADSVYRLLGTDGFAAQKMPALNEPVMSTIGYYMRTGGHDITLQDWQVHLDFANRHGRNLVNSSCL